MNIAIVGGGNRCESLMKLIEKTPFKTLAPKVVAVADIREDAPGVIMAREAGVRVTRDFHDLFSREDIDLIIELTGQVEVFREIEEKKRPHVRAIDHTTALFFWEFNRGFGLPAQQKKEMSKDINLQKGLVQQQKLSSIGQVAAGVAHEINNTLTTILTTSMLMQEDLDSSEPNYEELQTITNETLRCRKIVSGLLDYARQTKSVKADHQINKVVKQSIALIRKQAAFQDVVLEHNLAEDIPEVFIDKDQIQQCLINLALNAIVASVAGGKVTIATRVAFKGSRVEIAVRDTGKGISNGDLDHIFDPFFTTRKSGNGLGLAVTRSLIEKHGGSIGVESEPDKGTTFFVHLPIHGGEHHADKSTPDPGDR